MARSVIEQIKARPASDGDGVKLLRVFGGQGPERFDPFLMLDEFGSEEASDYIGGFPPHPHRGFETVTYMLQGKMEHRDHMNNVGLINDGDVQWMTAGKGVIHSEMPKQTEGKMRGFQFWINLPAENKLKPAYYEDVASEKIPTQWVNKIFVKAIAGTSNINGQEVKGYFDVPDTNALILDVHIPAGEFVTLKFDDSLNTLIYTYDGKLSLGSSAVKAEAKTLSRFAGEGELLVSNQEQDEARFILMAGKPLREPISQHGPFVMNSFAEIEKAVRDYQAGTFV